MATTGLPAMSTTVADERASQHVFLRKQRIGCVLIASTSGSRIVNVMMCESAPWIIPPVSDISPSSLKTVKKVWKETWEASKVEKSTVSENVRVTVAFG